LIPGFAEMRVILPKICFNLAIPFCSVGIIFKS
jgi:hypothetical protein